ncbi:MAG: DUF1320 family protein [Marinilabiliaceae bacterium]|nr:DUF1320 family protein [Marinilabiliaceae bacterium]
MWLKTEDYRPYIGERILALVSEADDVVRAMAENAAIEEVSGYLRAKYDTKKIFEEYDPERRNPMLIQVLVHVTLNNLYASMPNKLGAEARSERYESAIAWLSEVRDGRLQVDLPLIESDTDKPHNGFAVNMMKKNRYQW